MTEDTHGPRLILTDTQLSTLLFVAEFQARRNRSPSFAEIAAEFRIDPGSAHHRIARLGHAGAVTRPGPKEIKLTDHAIALPEVIELYKRLQDERDRENLARANEAPTA